jgi:hypothetical protein
MSSRIDESACANQRLTRQHGRPGSASAHDDPGGEDDSAYLHLAVDFDVRAVREIATIPAIEASPRIGDHAAAICNKAQHRTGTRQAADNAGQAQ